jgi:hypothetical protein
MGHSLLWGGMPAQWFFSCQAAYMSLFALRPNAVIFLMIF